MAQRISRATKRIRQAGAFTDIGIATNGIEIDMGGRGALTYGSAAAQIDGSRVASVPLARHAG
jgi:hypothetical protein